MRDAAERGTTQRLLGFYGLYFFFIIFVLMCNPVTQLGDANDSERQDDGRDGKQMLATDFGDNKTRRDATEDRADAATRSNQSEEAAPLFAGVNVRNEAQEHGDDEQVEDAQTDKICAAKTDSVAFLRDIRRKKCVCVCVDRNASPPLPSTKSRKSLPDPTKKGGFL